jgi:probable rRNA maturation factor
VLSLEVVNRSKVRFPKKFVDAWLKQSMRILSPKLSAKRAGQLRQKLIVAFVDGREARALNDEFRGRKYATDILSFESLEQGILGELVICPQVVRKQGNSHGLGFRQELAYMLVHGILHLLGFEHESGGPQAKKMFDLQDHIFETVQKKFEKK